MSMTLPLACFLSAASVQPSISTGKERDSESGNDYFGARYYASSMGRWLSPDWSAKEDPVPYAVLDDPQSLNLYQFVRNNPLSNRDDDGHGCPPDCGDPTAVTQVAPPSGIMQLVMLPVSGTIGMLKAGYNALLSGGTSANRNMGIPDTPAMQPANDGEKAGMTVAPLVVAAGIPELAPEVAPEATAASASSKVEGIIKTIDEGGFNVTPNAKTAGQEANVTITHPNEPGVKLNLRSESHPLPGSGGQDVPHVNVEKVTPRTGTTPKRIDNTHITQ